MLTRVAQTEEKKSQTKATKVIIRKGIVDFIWGKTTRGTKEEKGDEELDQKKTSTKVTEDKGKSGCHDNGMHATRSTIPRGVHIGDMTKCGRRTAEDSEEEKAKSQPANSLLNSTTGLSLSFAGFEQL